MSLVVVSVAGPISIQRTARAGRMHEGVPPGGAILPSLLAAANRAAGNHDDAPAIELLGRLVVRDDDGREMIVESQAWSYVAVPGGLEEPPLVMRLLRKGDRLRGPLIAPSGRTSPPGPDAARVRVVPGPDLDAFDAGALASLTAAPYEVVMPARTGARLRGATLARAPGVVERSRPMVRGAIEVPGDGMPIVLGPDHPTTGGYPILAVVASEDVERVFGASRVQFTT